MTPNYLLSDIRGNWAIFRPEDIHAPGYPIPAPGPGNPSLTIRKASEDDSAAEPIYRDGSHPYELKVGFSGDWVRHLDPERRPGEAISRRYRPSPSERDFAPGRDGKTELWLESKPKGFAAGWRNDGKGNIEATPCVHIEPVKIHAGCLLEDFVNLIRQGGGDVFLDEATRKLLEPTETGPPSPDDPQLQEKLLANNLAALGHLQLTQDKVIDLGGLPADLQRKLLKIVEEWAQGQVRPRS